MPARDSRDINRGNACDTCDSVTPPGGAEAPDPAPAHACVDEPDVVGICHRCKVVCEPAVAEQHPVDRYWRYTCDGCAWHCPDCGEATPLGVTKVVKKRTSFRGRRRIVKVKYVCPKCFPRYPDPYRKGP